MKKLMIVSGALVLVLALGTGVFAATSNDAGFKQMLPFMKQMHPNVSEQQLEDMYKSCHRDGADSSGMMNGNAGGMMNGIMSNMMGNSTILQ